jgi:hypothetical protein
MVSIFINIVINLTILFCWKHERIHTQFTHTGAIPDAIVDYGGWL